MTDDEQNRIVEELRSRLIGLADAIGESLKISKRIGSYCLDDPEWNRLVDLERPLAAEVIEALLEHYGGFDEDLE